MREGAPLCVDGHERRRCGGGCAAHEQHLRLVGAPAADGRAVVCGFVRVAAEGVSAGAPRGRLQVRRRVVAGGHEACAINVEDGPGRGEGWRVDAIEGHARGRARGRAPDSATPLI